jgi:hypothetical protein
VFGCEIDTEKVGYCQNNCDIYGVENKTIINGDYLKFDESKFSSQECGAIFLSPPWGGINYNKLLKYEFDYITPNMNRIMEKTFSLTKGLILHIPKNTCIAEICSVLSQYATGNEMLIEVEAINLKFNNFSRSNFHVICVYVDNVARISYKDIANHMNEEYFGYASDDSKVKCFSNLINVIEGGLSKMLDVFAKESEGRVPGKSYIEKRLGLNT